MSSSVVTLYLWQIEALGRFPTEIIRMWRTSPTNPTAAAACFGDRAHVSPSFGKISNLANAMDDDHVVCYDKND